MREQGHESDAQPKGIRVKEIARDRGVALRNGDPAQLQTPPGRDADPLDAQCCPETLAKLLLDPRLRPVRLDVQVHRQKKRG